jgi:hypothetical protein
MWVAIKVGGAILSASLTALSIGFIALNINANIPWIWIALISFLVFVGIVGQGWYVSEKNYRKLENAKPTVGDIREVDEEYQYYLEIENVGSTGEFTAQIKIMEDATGRYRDKVYVGYWVFDTRHHRSEIQTNHSDRLQIAHCHDRNINNIHLDYYDTQSNCLACLPFDWKDPITVGDSPFVSKIKASRRPPQCRIRVVISSKPDLREGSIVREYKLDVRELRGKLDKTPKIINLLKLIANQRRSSQSPQNSRYGH